jgi:hypothetical protein
VQRWLISKPEQRGYTSLMIQGCFTTKEESC